MSLRDRIAKAVLDKILVMFTENDPVESASAYIADAILAIPGIAVVELDHTIKWLDDLAKHCTETAEDCEEEPEAHCEEMFYRGQAVGFRIAAERFDVAAHQLNALRGNGIAVVELPEPDGMDGGSPYWGDAWGVRYCKGDGIEFEGHSMGLSDVKALAANLLAVADYVERDQ